MSLDACNAVLPTLPPPPHPQTASGLLRMLRLAPVKDRWERRWQYLLCQASLMQTCRAARDLVTFGANGRAMFFRHCLYFLLCHLDTPGHTDYNEDIPLFNTKYLYLLVPLPSRKLMPTLQLLLPVGDQFATRMRGTKVGCALDFIGFLSTLKCETQSTRPRKRPQLLLPADSTVHCRHDGSKEPRPMFRITHSSTYSGYLCVHCLADVLLRKGDTGAPTP